MHERAGTRALPEDLIDVDEVVSAYYDLVPDPAVPAQKVVFGTSGHRGSSLDTAFNEAHIVATTAAIVEYRALPGHRRPLYSAVTPTPCPSPRGAPPWRCLGPPAS